MSEEAESPQSPAALQTPTMDQSPITHQSRTSSPTPASPNTVVNMLEHNLPQNGTEEASMDEFGKNRPNESNEVKQEPTEMEVDEPELEAAPTETTIHNTEGLNTQTTAQTPEDLNTPTTLQTTESHNEATNVINNDQPVEVKREQSETRMVLRSRSATAVLPNNRQPRQASAGPVARHSTNAGITRVRSLPLRYFDLLI